MSKASQSDTTVVIRNVHWFDGQKFEVGTIVVKSSEIGADADTQGAETVDGQGKYLLPGLIDCHVHLRTEDGLTKLARYGVTTALDMATWPPAVMNSLQKAQPGRTAVRSAGIPATSPGSLHSRMPGLSDYLISNPGDAARWVGQRIAEGSDYIKLVADVPGPDQATLNALVAAAREHGKMTIAHAARSAAFDMALEAGVDFITHAPIDAPLKDGAVSMMRQNKQISVPTLSMMEAMPKVIGPPLNYAAAKASVKMLYEAGVPILAGTDANGGPGSSCPVPHGESMHHELELLVDSGLSTLDAIRAATVLPAKFFKLEDRGVIAAGKRADLVLLSANPLEDIRNTREIEVVWIGGVRV